MFLKLLFFSFCYRDLLFSQMYDKLSENSVSKGVFLECLEPYILSDKLVGITPQVMKDLIVHFQDKKLMDSVEALIVHMDITSLDIQQVSWQFAHLSKHCSFTDHVYLSSRPRSAFHRPQLCGVQAAVAEGVI